MLIANCKSDYLDYETAKMYCLFLEEQGLKGWRLPTAVEWEYTAQLTSVAWYQKSTQEERAILAKKYRYSQTDMDELVFQHENRSKAIAIAVRDE
jgi:formylglycine-generating enzyme required for sulfatase activity